MTPPISGPEYGQNAPSPSPARPETSPPAAGPTARERVLERWPGAYARIFEAPPAGPFFGVFAPPDSLRRQPRLGRGFTKRAAWEAAAKRLETEADRAD